MKKLNLLIGLLLVSLCFVSCEKEPSDIFAPLLFDKEALNVVLGTPREISVLTGKAPFKLHVTKPDIAKAAFIDQNKMVVEGLEVGETLVTVADKNGRVGAFVVAVRANKD